MCAAGRSHCARASASRCSSSSAVREVERLLRTLARRGGRRSRSARRRARRGARRGGRLPRRAARRRARAGSPRRADRRGQGRLRGLGEPSARHGQPARAPRFRLDAELIQVAERLLEVMADDLVELDEIGADLVQPAGEPLVEVRARRLRERVVRRVADEDVPEAERVVAGQLRALRPHELLAHEAEQTGTGPADRPARAPARPSRGTPAPRPRRARAPRVPHAATGRAAPTAAPGCSAAPSTSASGDASSIATISSTKSGLPSAAARMRSRRPGSTSPASSPSSGSLASRPSGSSRTVVACSLPPAQPGRRSSSSGRAMHRSRIGASRDQSATCSTRSRNASSAQCRSSHTTTSGRSRAASSNRRADREGDLLLRRDAVVSEHDAERPRDPRIELALVRPQLLDRLDERPVRDALAVREAPAARRPSRRCRAGTPRTRRDLPTPATPSSVKSWHALSDAATSNASRSRRCSRSRPTNGASKLRRVGFERRNRDEAKRFDLAATCLSTRAARPARRRPPRAQAAPFALRRRPRSAARPARVARRR